MQFDANIDADVDANAHANVMCKQSFTHAPPWLQYSVHLIHHTHTHTCTHFKVVSLIVIYPR